MDSVPDLLVFGDAKLNPAHSGVQPREVDLSTRLTRKLRLNIPLVSTAMDLAIESRLAIVLAQEGGLGIIHHNLSPERQAMEVDLVKRSESGLSRDSITTEDLLKRKKYPSAVRDECGRLRVGAVVGTGVEAHERARLLVAKGVDVLVVDSDHHHSVGSLRTVGWIKREYPQIQVVGGTVETPKGVEDLVEAGADALKVGAGSRQAANVFSCVERAAEFNVPVVFDGDIQYVGDIVKALAAGADTVMVKNLNPDKTQSPARGVILLTQGITSRMESCECLSLEEFRKKARLCRIPSAGLRKRRGHRSEVTHKGSKVRAGHSS
jgi:IMP dehydrogenase